MNMQQPPWSDHLPVAETMGQSVAEALASLSGAPVDLGKPAAFDPQSMLETRPLPVRAFVVRFHRPLRDVAIFLTSLQDEAIRPYVERAAQAIVSAVEVPEERDQHGALGTWEIGEAVEFDELPLALEQCDALFLEATYSLELPTGELRLVLGTGLLESASSFVDGVADPFAEEAPIVTAGTELALGDAIGVDDAARYELGDGVVVEPGASELELAGGGSIADRDASIATAAAAMGGIDGYDAMLAEQARTEAEAAAAVAASQATASANVAAAELPDMGHEAATQRWTQLLSGVEVELSAELGRAQLALGDIASLASDSVLTLDQLVHEPVTVFVNGTPYATARLVVVDGEYGIEILTVVEQETLVTSLAAA